MFINKDLLSPKNNYCVYLHKRADNGDVFYIGSGVQNKREKHFTARSKAWHEVKDNFGVVVEIFKADLDKVSARNLEESLINSGNYPNLINKKEVVKSYSSVSKSEFAEFVYYDESSPTCLRWRVVTGPRCKVDEPVGSIICTKDGTARSITTKINGRNVKVSRIIWALFNELTPEDMIIDHIDNNPHNNKIENLRCITIAENSRNRQRNKGSKSEFPGIYRRETNYTASVSINGVNKSTTYAFSKYGEELALQKCLAWRKSMLLMANEVGANYSDHHIPVVSSSVDYIARPAGVLGLERIRVKRDKNLNIVSVSAFTLYKDRGREVSFSVSKYGFDQALHLAQEFVNKEEYCNEDFEKRTNVTIKLVFIDTREEIGTYKSVVQAAKETGLSTGTFYKRLDGQVKGNAKYQGREIEIIRLSQTN